MQVATTATFSACALEALRMLLADLEQPGGTLTNPFRAPLALLMPIALALFPTVLPAGFVGDQIVYFCCVYASCTDVHCSVVDLGGFFAVLVVQGGLLGGVYACSYVIMMLRLPASKSQSSSAHKAPCCVASWCLFEAAIKLLTSIMQAR